MATTNYLTFGDEIVYENRAGTERDYMRDPIGSTAALLDNTQTQTDTFFYWPYGEQRTRTGTSATPFLYIGGFGYFYDNATGLSYIRARYLVASLGRWITVDHKWPELAAYCYAQNAPTVLIDPMGEMAMLAVVLPASGILGPAGPAIVLGAIAATIIVIAVWSLLNRRPDPDPNQGRKDHCSAECVEICCYQFEHLNEWFLYQTCQVDCRAQCTASLGLGYICLKDYAEPGGH